MSKANDETYGNTSNDDISYVINNGKNSQVLRRCRTLREYSQFVSIVRERAAKEPLTDVVMKEILEHCIAQDILAEFLNKHGIEVISMLFEQLTEEEAREISKQDGYEIGKREGKLEDLFDFLTELGEVPDQLRERILNQRDLEILKSWIKLAARARSIEEFEKEIV